jgi:hypothetical protein
MLALRMRHEGAAFTLLDRVDKMTGKYKSIRVLQFIFGLSLLALSGVHVSTQRSKGFAQTVYCISIATFSLVITIYSRFILRLSYRFFENPTILLTVDVLNSLLCLAGAIATFIQSSFCVSEDHGVDMFNLRCLVHFYGDQALILILLFGMYCSQATY